MVKLAMLSRWHLHARLYVRQLYESGKAEVVAVWDEDSARGQEWADTIGCDFHANLDDVLARSDVDGVVVDAPTSMHAEILMKAARAGKHIFTEKAMTLTMAEAREVEKVIRESGVMFMISFVHRINGAIDFMKDAIDKGLLGEISKFRMHYSHSGASAGWLPDYWFDGKTAGGGALMDLGCHHLYVARYLMGEPSSIYSQFNTLTGRGDVEDNAECLIQFKNKAIGSISTSLVAYAAPSTTEIYGTKGAIYHSSGPLRMCTQEMDEKLGGKHVWFEPTLPPNSPIPIHQFINALHDNDASHIGYGLQDGIELTQLIEGAYRSHKEKKVICF